MAIDFSKLKKSGAAGGVSKLQEALDKVNTKSYEDDKRFWSPTRGKDGSGGATIRFLPPADDDGNGVPFIKYHEHSFKGPGGWYIELCRTSLGENDPLCEANNALWETGTEANQTIVRSRKRKLKYVSNILVINDPADATNNGKVKLFRYGAKIFEKITAAAAGGDDEEPINVFDLWEGANFKLVVKQVAGYPNYDASKFLKKSVVGDYTDKQIQDLVLNNLHELQPLVAPDKFKSYADLQTRLTKALGNKAAKPSVDDFDESTPSKEAKKQKSKKTAHEDEDETPWVPSNDGDDDVKGFFDNLE